jgi:putative DNA primase/helicase
MNKLQKTFDDIVDRTRAKQIGTAGSFNGLCLAHDDSTPSLSISLVNDKILLNCHTGCTIDDICVSLGIKQTDLFAHGDEKQINRVPASQKAESEEKRMKANINTEGKVVFFSSKHKKQVTESVRYSYFNADGKTAYHVIRSDPKGFRPMTPDGYLGLEGLERVPYRLPDLLQGVKDLKLIFLLEGEKDVDRAMDMRFVATTFVGGAGKWREEYSEYFRGADVVLIPDNDFPGLKGMTEIATKLHGTASRIRLLELPGLGPCEDKHGKDFSDWADLDGNTSVILNDLVMETEDCELPLNDWIYPSKSGVRINKALVAEHISQDQNGNLIYVNQNFWSYAGGIWERIEDVQIKAQIRIFLSSREEIKYLITSALIEDVYKQVGIILLVPPDFLFNREPMVLNFSNGTLDLNGGLFSVLHRRELFQNIQFPYNFNRDAHCPNWDLFLKSLEFDPDTLRRLQEWAGYCLLPMVYGNLQKSLFFIGEGANGKSVFLETLAAVLDNVSHLELSELFDRFKIAELEGKLANICTDVETTKVMDARFKKIVAGEPQSAERKFKNPFEFQPFAKILFSANEFILTKDRTHGFYRRFDILRFNRIFKLNEQKPDLLQELKKEVPGIFNWALKGLERLSQQKWIMTKSAYMEDCHNEFKRATNPLQLFIEEECVVEGNAIVDSNEFRSSYKQYCEDKGYKPLSDNKLGQDLKRLGINKTRIRTEEGRINLYEGIQLLSGSVHSVHSLSIV